MENIIMHRNTGQHLGNNNLERIRSLLCTILSFLLSLAFVGLAVLFVIQSSCFSRASFYRNLLSSLYYQNVLSEIYKSAESITIPTGLSIEVLDNTIESYEVHQDINDQIDAGIKGEAYHTDTSLLESRLEKNINDYLTREGIQPDQEQKKNIGLYITSIANEYIDIIKIPLFNSLISTRKTYHKIFSIGLTICILIIIITLSMLLKMNRWVHRALRYMTYSTTAAAFMIATIPGILLYSGIYQRIQLSPHYFYNFAMTFITNTLKMMLHYSICLAAISVFLMIIIKIMKIKLTQLITFRNIQC